jgi:aspartyl-tRNA synthetase
MTQKAEDLMMGAPNFATAKQLRELNIRLVDQPNASKASPVTEAVDPAAG